MRTPYPYKIKDPYQPKIDGLLFQPLFLEKQMKNLDINTLLIPFYFQKHTYQQYLAARQLKQNVYYIYLY